MIDIPQSVKNAYIEGVENKYLEITFPDLDYTVPTNEVYYESMSLKEGILDDESFTVAGCIASEFECTIRKFDGDIKSQSVEVYIYTESTSAYKIPLFHGKVDSVENIANQGCWKFIAYDALYELQSVSINNWYQNTIEPMIEASEVGYITLKVFRDSLFEYLGIEQVEQSLPGISDPTWDEDEGGGPDYGYSRGDRLHISAKRAFEQVDMNAFDTIRNICEICGVFGKINRDGKFQYIPFKPMAIEPEDVPYHSSFEWQNFMVYPFSKVIVRDSEDDDVSADAIWQNTSIPGNSTYVVEGNMFARNREDADLQIMARVVMLGAGGNIYIPFDGKCPAMPWVEVGESVLTFHSYDFDNSTGDTDVYEDISAVIYNREMSGIQALTDSFNISGDEKKTVFGSGENLNSQVVRIQAKLNERGETKNKKLYAANWQVDSKNRIYYNIGSRYKNRTVNIGLDGDNLTNEQYTAALKAKLIGGSKYGNIIYCKGTQPTIDIPIILVVS